MHMSGLLLCWLCVENIFLRFVKTPILVKLLYNYVLVLYSGILRDKIIDDELIYISNSDKELFLL